jgi:Tubulin like
MNKNLIIGIGGTGLSAIRELRRLIAERYRDGLQDPSVASVGFLYIDTDENEAPRCDWSVLGKDVSLKESEKVIISGDRLKPIVDHPSNYPEIASWLPNIKAALTTRS